MKPYVSMTTHPAFWEWVSNTVEALRPRWVQIGDDPHRYHVVYKAKFCDVLKQRRDRSSSEIDRSSADSTQEA